MFFDFEKMHVIMGYSWLIAALFLIILEVGTPGLFFFLSLAFGAACTAPFAFLNFSFFSQTIIWIIFSCIGLLGMSIFIKKKELETAKTNINALIGQEAVVIASIEPHRIGQVKVKGEQWPAIAHNGLILHHATIVTIVGIQGNKLIVR